MKRTVVKVFIICLGVVLPIWLFAYTVADALNMVQYESFRSDYLFPGALAIGAASLAIYAIFLTILYSDTVKSSIDEVKLRRVTKACNENTGWTFVFFLVMLGLPVYEEQGFWYLSWDMVPFLSDRFLAIRTFEVLLLGFMAFATFDTLVSAMSILKQSQNVSSD